ncbi:ABC transporter, permease protein [Bifidobacterium dolichotidis]|uniref:ABC transporter, permease protein n=1 Tax=Bifidobacterium dolichotidis TaxID=2306976 RepID=A0A430FTP0_9BIFI|nr:sugar ABC transporter permease [Bifidobacterium dolichotidis]RSX56188.1 ABC transporter, permease protein [Bifidobacterium dolichotidis]
MMNTGLKTTRTAEQSVQTTPAHPASPQLKSPQPKSAQPSHRLPAMMLLPACIIIALLVVIPFIMLVIASLTNFNMRSLFTGEFDLVGFKQYAQVFTSSQFLYSLGITIVFTAVLVATSMLLGMGVAQMMTRLGSVLRTLVSIALVLAWALPNVASALIFAWMFQPGYGVINWMLSQLQMFGDVRNLSWTTNPVLAFVCIWLLVIWQAVPYIAITVYAAQSQLDSSYLEAASLDGAGPIRSYWSITVPLLSPQLIVIGVLSTIWDFNIFNQTWLLTQGGPNDATATVGIYAYRQAFVSFDIGRGAAISMITTVLLLALTGVYLRRMFKAGKEV